MFYSDDIIEEIRSRNDIVDVISGYVKLQKKGSSYFGLCPFHNEKSPSFSVSQTKQMYYCFGCGAGGNVITFIMEYENYSFQEAIKYLADRCGMSLPKADENEVSKKQQSERKILLDIQKTAAKYYYYLLGQPQGKQGLNYLTGRGLSKETITRFGLGYSSKFGNDLYKYLKSKGYSDALLKESGLITFDERKGAYDKFWNRVMYPIMDVNNRVIGFGGRVMGDGTPKYLNSPETKIFDKSRNLYGLNFARISRKPYFIICEGYMDVISMHQAGFTNAIASLGTAFTSPHASLIKRYVDEVYLAYDSDGAGIKAALRAIPILKSAGLKIKIIHMDPYKDPDEFIKNLGRDAFEERIGKAENSFLFEISVLEKSYDLNDPQGKTDFFNAAAKKMLEFNQELERNNYIEAICRRYGIDFKDMQKLVNSYGARIGYVEKSDPERAFEPAKSKKKPVKEEGILTCQKLLLTWLVEDPSLFPKVEKYISYEDFLDPVYQKAAKLLFDEYNRTGKVTPARIMNQFEDKEEHNIVASLFNTNLYDSTDKNAKEKALNEAVIKIKKHSIDHISKNAKDIQTLQAVVKARASLQTLHISL